MALHLPRDPEEESKKLLKDLESFSKLVKKWDDFFGNVDMSYQPNPPVGEPPKHIARNCLWLCVYCSTYQEKLNLKCVNCGASQ